MLRNNEPAPHFALHDSEGVEVALDQYVGKPLVIIFFRGKFCPTTNRNLATYQDFYARIKDMGMDMVGISYDTVANHAELKQRLSIKYKLLSDPSLKTISEYGLYVAPNLQGEDYGEPALFILDKNGKVAYSIVSSGAKGLPDPGAIASTLIYMAFHGGEY